MMSIYDKIRLLPLFLGATDNHVSAFVGKHKVSFNYFHDGMTVLARNARCSSLLCVISGETRVVRHITDDIDFSFILPEGAVYGVESIFGPSSDFPFDVFAVSDVNTLSFSKEDYVDFLLSNDPIFIFNFANVLSLRAQRPNGLIPFRAHLSAVGFLRMLVTLYSDRVASRFTLTTNIFKLADLLRESSDIVMASLNRAVAAGVIIISDNEIIIPERNEFLDYSSSVSE